MFLQNWDVSKTYRICEAATGLNKENRDSENWIRKYDGNYQSNYLSYDTAYYWSNGYYQSSPQDAIGDDSYLFIWPGGDIDGTPARITNSIERDTVRYEDFNLYSPFYGGNDPSHEGTIYGQTPVLSGVTYNAEKDQWERTVTREFKNKSDKTITVRELGVFRGRYVKAIVAREILDTPIEVKSDGYFKISFTWKVENPHEHREVKRIRQYSFPHYYRNNGDTNTWHSISSPKKQKMLLVRSYSIYTTSTLQELDYYKEKFQITHEGWDRKNLTYFILDDRATSSHNSERQFISIDLLIPDETDLNQISLFHGRWNVDGYYTFGGYVYLEDTIQDIEYLDTIKQLANPIIGNKLSLDTNIIWIGIGNIVFTQASGCQKDYDYCDYYYEPGTQLATFFFDITRATEHIFHISNSSDYEGIALVKLQAITANDENGNPIPLYEDIPVQR